MGVCTSKCEYYAIALILDKTACSTIYVLMLAVCCMFSSLPIRTLVVFHRIVKHEKSKFRGYQTDNKLLRINKHI